MMSEAEVRESIARGVHFLQGVREPHALLFMNILYRRFGIAEFADTLERYDQVIAERPEEAPVLRVLRRIADGNNPIRPDDWDHVNIQTDRLLVTALYCDRVGLPDEFGDALVRAVSQGGYAATHALLAWTWVLENDCPLTLPEGFLEHMFGTVARIIDEDPTSLNDIKLEAGAFLCLARQSPRVDLGFVRRIFAIQNADGGWGKAGETAPDPNVSSWHATILALMIIVHVSFPGGGKLDS